MQSKVKTYFDWLYPEEESSGFAGDSS